MQTTIYISFLKLLISLILLFRLCNSTAIRGNNVIDVSETEFRNKFPFVVAIAVKNTDHNVHPNDVHVCTGTLITRFHVLTAKHCLDDEDKDHLEIRVDDVNIHKGTKYNISSWITFAEWYQKTKQKDANELDDVAIITLTKSVSNIKLPTVRFLDGDELWGLTVQTAGWGEANGENIPEILKTAKFQVMTSEECKKKFHDLKEERIYVYNRFVCSNAKPWTLLGGGDSGGPLLNKNYALVGINKGTLPNISHHPQEFQDQNQLNFHISLQYFEQFIRAATKVIPTEGRKKC